jgi:hypothetical protein
MKTKFISWDRGVVTRLGGGPGVGVLFPRNLGTSESDIHVATLAMGSFTLSKPLVCVRPKVADQLSICSDILLGQVTLQD